ncbi:hypothetical protein HZB01_01985 [Candidatus Woesearchaeota archaeon]|nr:hypothetical protein [Candidatus Woesearchaeota archaeon]
MALMVGTKKTTPKATPKTVDYIMVICVVAGVTGVGAFTNYNLVYTLVGGISGTIIGLFLKKVISKKGSQN